MKERQRYNKSEMISHKNIFFIPFFLLGMSSFFIDEEYDAENRAGDTET